jgi:O-antigen ligase
MKETLIEKRNQLEIAMWMLLALGITPSLSLTSYPIGILLLLFFIDEKPISKLKQLFSNAWSYVFFLPFILSIIGMINTENTTVGWQYIQVSLSFIIFPFIAFSFSKNPIKKKWSRLFTSFTMGILISFVFCIVRAIVKYPEFHSTNVFFYKKLSELLMSPNHLANYVIFGIIITALELTDRKQKYLNIKSVYLLIIIIVTQIVFLILLASKANFLLLIFAVIYFFIYWGRHKILSWKFIIAIAFFSITGFLIVISQTMIAKRITNTEKAFHANRIDYNIPESTTLRLSALQASSDIISQYWYIGVGTGDVRDVLTKYYKDNQYNAAYKYGTNPHNQFLRSFLSYGISGLASVLLIFAAMLFQAIKYNKTIIYLWIAMMILLFLFDDMLSIQAGVIYFCMFSSLFTFAINKYQKNDSFFTSKNRR